MCTIYHTIFELHCQYTHFSGFVRFYPDEHEHEEGQHNNDDDPRPGKCHVPGLECDIYRCRQCLCTAGNVAGDDDGGAELTECAGKAEECSGNEGRDRKSTRLNSSHVSISY